MLNEAAFEKRNISTIDFSSAYLNAELKSVAKNGDQIRVHIRLNKQVTDIVLELYPELAKYVLKNGCMICSVQRALYGLIESAMLWYEHLKRDLIAIGYTMSLSDHGVFFRMTSSGKSTLCVHVDDILCTSTSPSMDEYLQSELKKRYNKITVHNGARLPYLGMTIAPNKKHGLIELSQTGYIKDILQEHKISHSFNTPYTSSFLRTKKGCERSGC